MFKIDWIVYKDRVRDQQDKFQRTSQRGQVLPDRNERREKSRERENVYEYLAEYRNLWSGLNEEVTGFYRCPA